MKYFFSFFLIAGNLQAQEIANWDTLKYQKFHSNLIVGIFQSYYNFSNEFTQPNVSDSAIIPHNHYKAESRLFTGISATYDKFSFAIALRSQPQDGSYGKGNSNTFVSNFNIGGNVWFIENAFRYFKGFYDSNSPSYDSSYQTTHTYLFKPEFLNILGRSKFMYFTNHHKYSFRANTSCNYRQLKSAATWIFSANANYNFMRNDSSFFPAATQATYGIEGGLNRFSSFGLSLNAGAAATIVFWRAFFFSAMILAGPEQQWRIYGYPEGSSRLSYISFSGDLRFAIGLNFKRFYLTSFSVNESVLYNSTSLKMVSNSISGGFIMGYRFNSRVPSFYRKIQKSKLYLAL